MTGLVTKAGTLFGIMVAHTLLETARDALFLAKLGADKLVWAYLAIAGTALLAVGAARRFCGLLDPRRVLIAFLALSGIGTLVLALGLSISPSSVFGLYVWTGLVATLVVPAFWTVVDGGLDVGDARKQFSTIAAGGVFGALAGSAVATVLGWLVDPIILVWLAAAVMLGTSIAAWSFAPARRRASPPRARASNDRRTRGYLRWILIAGLLSTVTLTFADLIFKRLLGEHVPGASLATAFGAIYTALNLVGLVIQLAITPRLFDRLGVGATLTILPVSVIASAAGFVLTGSMVAILALKLADGGMRHSIYRVANEILFLPVPDALRDRAKPIIEAIGTRGGQAAAALLALALAGSDGLAGVTLIAGVGWLVALAITRRRYVEQFRGTLEAGDILRDVRVPTLDNDSIALLTASLSSPDEDEARAALDLLARRGDRVPALVLYHPSPAIVRRALSLLEGSVRLDVERVLRHLIAHPDPEIRASALAAAARTGTHADRVRAALVDPEPEVRAAAAVAAVLETDERCEVLQDMLSASTAARAAVARAIARHPQPRFRAILDELVANREPAVTREVLRVWQRAPELAHPDRLIQMLDDPRVRGEARRVIAVDGSRYFDRLLRDLDDPRTPLGVRRHLPRTISRFATPAAATALVSRLVREPDGTTEFKILRALGRMRASHPQLPVDSECVLFYIRRSIGDAERYAGLAREVGRHAVDPTLQLLGELLAEKQAHAIERVFRALAVLHPRSELRAVHDAITSQDRERKAAAREVVENLLPAAIRVPLLAALEPSGGPSRSFDELIALLLADHSDAVRCIAAHHVAERHLTALRDEITRLRPYASSLVGHAFDQAIARLDA